MKDFFPELNEEETAQLEPFLMAKSATVGTILVELGSTDRDLYLLKSGACEVYQKFCIGQKLFALRVGTLGGPVILGEANLLLGEKRNATIIVSKDMEYFKLSHENFNTIRKEHAGLTIKLLDELGKVACRRYLGMQKAMMERFLMEEPSPTKGLDYLKKFIGNVHPCSRELAKKLFGIDQPSI